MKHVGVKSGKLSTVVKERLSKGEKLELRPQWWDEFTQKILGQKTARKGKGEDVGTEEGVCLEHVMSRKKASAANSSK